MKLRATSFPGQSGSDPALAIFFLTEGRSAAIPHLEVTTLGRKNKRAKSEYRDRLGFNPRKYINSSDDFHGGEERHPFHSAVERREPRRGDVWFAELGDHFGTSVQGGCRPVLVISNDMGNRCSDIVNVIPMTSRMKKYYLPSHTIVEESHMSERDENREYETSMILAEQITTISKASFRSYLGRVTDAEKLKTIESAVRVQLGLS